MADRTIDCQVKLVNKSDNCVYNNSTQFILISKQNPKSSFG